MLWSKAIGAGGTAGAVAPTVAYVTSATYGITSIDISNPSSMSQLDNLVNYNLGGAYGVALDTANSVAYVASISTDSITSIDISNPSSMSQLGTFTSSDLNGAAGIDIDAVNGVAYVVSKMTPDPPEHIQHLVENVRIPRGAKAVDGTHIH